MTHTLRNGLIAFYSFDEASGDALDLVNGRNFTAQNSPTADTGVVGGSRYMATSGSPQHFTRASDTAFDFTTQMAISFWFKKTEWNLASNSYQHIIGRGTPVGNPSWAIDSISGTGVGVSDPSIVLRFNGGSNSSNGYRTPLVDNTWYFGVLNYNGGEATSANRARYYLNNSLQSPDEVSGTIPTTLPASGQNLHIGLRPSYTTGNTDLWLDAISVWNRILTSDERTALYNSGNGLQVPPFAPVAANYNKRRRAG